MDYTDGTDTSSFGLRHWSFIRGFGFRNSFGIGHSAFGQHERLAGKQIPNDEVMPKPESPNE
jgi:hypothetical protein